jgi:hypothetical protein
MSLFRNRTSNSKFLLVFSFARILLCCNSDLPHETKGMMKWVVLLLQQLLAHGQEPPQFICSSSKQPATMAHGQEPQQFAAHQSNRQLQTFWQIFSSSSSSIWWWREKSGKKKTGWKFGVDELKRGKNG